MMKKRPLVALLLAASMVVGQAGIVSAARSVSQIEDDKKNLEKEIGALDSEIQGIVASMAEIEAEIAIKQEEIAAAEIEVEQAQAAVDKQYEDMKIRIQFMYENSDQSVLAILLESGSIADFLNRLEYVNSVHTYDRDLLEAFEGIQKELEDMKLGLEMEKQELVTAENALAAKEQELNQILASKKSKYQDIEKELATAKEAARKAAEEEERRRRQDTGGGGNGGSTGTQEDLNPGKTTDISGSDVVAYANQFVGNPYVWGGNSLTSGCDCSGFVHLVYKEFGLSLPRYSMAFATVGKEVSYNNMQPGDIIVYTAKGGIGHVAIYAGGGLILEAQSSAAGITNNRAANCRDILTIRRVI